MSGTSGTTPFSHLKKNNGSILLQVALGLSVVLALGVAGLNFLSDGLKNMTTSKKGVEQRSLEDILSSLLSRENICTKNFSGKSIGSIANQSMTSMLGHQGDVFAQVNSSTEWELVDYYLGAPARIFSVPHPDDPDRLNVYVADATFRITPKVDRHLNILRNYVVPVYFVTDDSQSILSCRGSQYTQDPKITIENYFCELRFGAGYHYHPKYYSCILP